MTKRRLVIHNHLPARRAKDAPEGGGKIKLVEKYRGKPSIEVTPEELKKIRREGIKIGSVHYNFHDFFMYKDGFFLPKESNDARDAFVNLRELAGLGKTLNQASFKPGEHVDFYAPPGGDKLYGKVLRNDGSQVEFDVRGKRYSLQIVSRSEAERLLADQNKSGNDARDNYFRVKRGDDGNGGVDWFVQSDDEEVVGDKTFKSRSEAEAYARQRQARERQDGGRDARDHAFRVGQITGGETDNTYEIWEGAGVDGGTWFVKHRGKLVYKAKSRREAEEHAEMS
jgi:hypothetical protein